MTGKRKCKQVAKHMEQLSRKASSDNLWPARTKTDKSGQPEDAMVSERTLVKELGKMTP